LIKRTIGGHSLCLPPKIKFTTQQVHPIKNGKSTPTNPKQLSALKTQCFGKTKRKEENKHG